MTQEEILSVMEDGAKKAGELILSAHDIIAKNKTDARNVVTEYDVRVQNMLIKLFSENFPGAHFFCEESDTEDSLEAEHVFIIDPIDGTANFVHGLKQSSVSIAHMTRGVIDAGAVYNPYFDELYTALLGKGARLNGERLAPDNVPLSQSLVAVGTSPYNKELNGKTFRMMRAVHEAGLDIRRGGSAAIDMCSVAAGRVGLFAEQRLCFWDYAAGMLIVREAGGVCSDISGAPLPVDGSVSSFLCGTERAVSDFLALKCSTEE